jgi:hypothetical protein
MVVRRGRTLPTPLMQKCILVLILLLSLAACSPAGQIETQTANIPAPAETQTPEITPTHTTIPATPTATLAPTLTFTPSITPEPTERRGTFINIFCLKVTQSIEGSTVIPNEPISETVGRVLAGAGLVFVSNAEYCDAVLRLDFIFTPLAPATGGAQPCYTGVALRGSADLTWQGSSLYHRDLQAETTQPGSTGACPTQEEAPFLKLWPAAAMQALTEIWGKNVLVPALSDPFRVVREAGAQSLALLGEGEILSFLPFLSTLLADPSEVVHLRLLEALQRCVADEALFALAPQIIAMLREGDTPEVIQAALTLLKTLSGEDFGMDAQQWQAWWDTQN